MCSAEGRRALLDDFSALSASKPMGDYAREDDSLHTGTWTWQSAVQKGRMSADFAAQCPSSASLLGSVPDLLLQGVPFSYAFFSFLKKGAVIAPHYGPASIRLRVHIPLILPSSPSCRLTVAGEPRTWQQGAPLIFDDTFLHSAENETNEDRLIFLFDVWQPSLSPEEREGIVGMFDLAREKGWLK
jgi:aspartate beta-hydroxylase